MPTTIIKTLTILLTLITPLMLPVTINRAIDGDTLKITLQNGKTERGRLLCVDTQESIHPATTTDSLGVIGDSH